MIEDLNKVKETMLKVIRQSLGYTWEDPDIDAKLNEYIADGIAYLDRQSAGSKLSFDVGTPERRILKDYVFYANAKALDEFVDNYIGELLEFQYDQEVKANAEESTAAP